jgi:hypothetical protein
LVAQSVVNAKTNLPGGVAARNRSEPISQFVNVDGHVPGQVGSISHRRFSLIDTSKKALAEEYSISTTPPSHLTAIPTFLTSVRFPG